MDSFLDTLERFAPILYVVVPAIAGVYFKLREKIKAEEVKIRKQSLEKRKEEYNSWIQNESRYTIKKIRDLCNLYKDKTDVDLVHYLQLENGTIATSKLHNMFISCLAEDSRFGKLPKLITHVQRIPYNNFIEFLGEVTPEGNNNYIGVCEDSNINVPERPFLCKEVKSYLYIPIHDMHNNIIGVGVFYFAFPHFNGKNLEDKKNYLRQFQSGVEAVFFDFLMNRNRKRDELLLEEGDIL